MKYFCDLLRKILVFGLACLMGVMPAVQAISAVRAIVAVTFPLAGFLSAFPRISMAGPFEDAAAQGNAMGRTELGNVRLPSSNPNAGTVTINSANPAVNGQTFNLNQLFQGAGSTANGAALANGAATYGNTANMNTQAVSQQNRLMDMSNTDEWANAYRTVRGAALAHSHPDMSNDPIARDASKVVQGQDTNHFVNSMAAACSTIQVPKGGSSTTHIPDIRECTRYNGLSSCRVTRNLETRNTTKNVLHIEGPIDHILTTRIKMRTPTEISVNAAGYRDEVSSAVAAAGGFYSETVDWGLGDYPVSMQLRTFSEAEWPVAGANQIVAYKPVDSIAGDVTYVTINPPSPENGYVMSIDMLTPPPGVQHFSIDIVATVTVITEKPPIDEPPGCSTPSATCGASAVPWTSSGSVNDQASTDRWACTNADVSRGFGAVNLTGANFGPIKPLFPGEPTSPTSPVCYEAEARQYKCYDGGTGLPPADTCGALQSNAQCVFQKSECLPENVDPVSGRCLFFQETYDCGQDVVIGIPGTSTRTSCAGPVRCMGEDCFQPLADEANPDFNKAAAQMQTAQWAQMDKDCTADGCEIFKGDGYSCKIAFFGIQDCCDTPVGVSYADYIKLAYYTWKVSDRQAIATAMSDMGLNTVTSAWESLTDPISATIGDLTRPLVDAWDSLLSRATDAIFPAKEATAEAVGQTFGARLDAWVQEVFPELSDALIDTGLSSTGSLADLGSNIMNNVLGPIMTVYMYYQIAVILIQIIWSCDDREFELNVKKQMKMCHYLGRYCSQRVLGICITRRNSFCCYKSPLSRIIHEQINLHYGIPWPGASGQPTCPGFTPDQLASVDWSQIDLSEWIADLQQAGMMPNSTESADSFYGAARLTALPTADGITGSNAVKNATDALSESKTPAAQPTASMESARMKLWGNLP